MYPVFTYMRVLSMQVYVLRSAARLCWSFVMYRRRRKWRSTWTSEAVSIRWGCCPGRRFILSGCRREGRRQQLYHTLCSVWHLLAVLSNWRAWLIRCIAGSSGTSVSFTVDIAIDGVINLNLLKRTMLNVVFVLLHNSMNYRTVHRVGPGAVSKLVSVQVSK